MPRAALTDHRTKRTFPKVYPSPGLTWSMLGEFHALGVFISKAIPVSAHRPWSNISCNSLRCASRSNARPDFRQRWRVPVRIRERRFFVLVLSCLRWRFTASYLAFSRCRVGSGLAAYRARRRAATHFRHRERPGSNSVKCLSCKQPVQVFHRLCGNIELGPPVVVRCKPRSRFTNEFEESLLALVLVFEALVYHLVVGINAR